MNGVHDMGGMHGMGPVQPEQDEPVFHHRWEARVFALVRAMGKFGRWNIDAHRHQRELIPAAEQLRMSYYERWLAGFSGLLVRHGFLSAEELATGRPVEDASVAGSARLSPALPADKVPAFIASGSPASRKSASAPRFRAGQRVRARNLNPTGHTRLPRYARGKTGIVDRVHGVFVFPDTNAHFLGEHPQHVYSVRFEARELWGDAAAPQDSVHVDLWESYLEAG
ncbi:MAG TPA: nitrile hydratase subunit beta [Steroidobacteraceae bacterium]|nr:nitrile hydratase subunit beta [Steroidobacteraceae bacterium]